MRAVHLVDAARAYAAVGVEGLVVDRAGAEVVPEFTLGIDGFRGERRVLGLARDGGYSRRAEDAERGHRENRHDDSADVTPSARCDRIAGTQKSVCLPQHRVELDVVSR